MSSSSCPPQQPPATTTMSTSTSTTKIAVFPPRVSDTSPKAHLQTTMSGGSNSTFCNNNGNGGMDGGGGGSGSPPVPKRIRSKDPSEYYSYYSYHSTTAAAKTTSDADAGSSDTRSVTSSRSAPARPIPTTTTTTATTTTTKTLSFLSTSNSVPNDQERELFDIFRKRAFVTPTTTTTTTTMMSDPPKQPPPTTTTPLDDHNNNNNNHTTNSNDRMIVQNPTHNSNSNSNSTGGGGGYVSSLTMTAASSSSTTSSSTSSIQQQRQQQRPNHPRQQQSRSMRELMVDAGLLVGKKEEGQAGKVEKEHGGDGGGGHGDDVVAGGDLLHGSNQSFAMWIATPSSTPPRLQSRKKTIPSAQTSPPQQEQTADDQQQHHQQDHSVPSVLLRRKPSQIRLEQTLHDVQVDLLQMDNNYPVVLSSSSFASTPAIHSRKGFSQEEQEEVEEETEGDIGNNNDRDHVLRPFAYSTKPTTTDKQQFDSFVSMNSSAGLEVERTTQHQQHQLHQQQLHQQQTQPRPQLESLTPSGVTTTIPVKTGANPLWGSTDTTESDAQQSYYVTHPLLLERVDSTITYQSLMSEITMNTYRSTNNNNNMMYNPTNSGNNNDTSNDHDPTAAVAGSTTMMTATSPNMVLKLDPRAPQYQMFMEQLRLDELQKQQQQEHQAVPPPPPSRQQNEIFVAGSGSDYDRDATVRTRNRTSDTTTTTITSATMMGGEEVPSHLPTHHHSTEILPNEMTDAVNKVTPSADLPLIPRRTVTPPPPGGTTSGSSEATGKPPLSTQSVSTNRHRFVGKQSIANESGTKGSLPTNNSTSLRSIPSNRTLDDFDKGPTVASAVSSNGRTTNGSPVQSVSATSVRGPFVSPSDVQRQFLAVPATPGKETNPLQYPEGLPVVPQIPPSFDHQTFVSSLASSEALNDMTEQESTGMTTHDSQKNNDNDINSVGSAGNRESNKTQSSRHSRHRLHSMVPTKTTTDESKPKEFEVSFHSVGNNSLDLSLSDPNMIFEDIGASGHSQHHHLRHLDPKMKASMNQSNTSFHEDIDLSGHIMLMMNRSAATVHSNTDINAENHHDKASTGQNSQGSSKNVKNERDLTIDFSGHDLRAIDLSKHSIQEVLDEAPSGKEKEMKDEYQTVRDQVELLEKEVSGGNDMTETSDCYEVQLNDESVSGTGGVDSTAAVIPSDLTTNSSGNDNAASNRDVHSDCAVRGISNVTRDGTEGSLNSMPSMKSFSVSASTSTNQSSGPDSLPSLASSSFDGGTMSSPLPPHPTKSLSVSPSMQKSKPHVSRKEEDVSQRNINHSSQSIKSSSSPNGTSRDSTSGSSGSVSTIPRCNQYRRVKNLAMEVEFVPPQWHGQYEGCSEYDDNRSIVTCVYSGVYSGQLNEAGQMHGHGVFWFNITNDLYLGEFDCGNLHGCGLLKIEVPIDPGDVKYDGSRPTRRFKRQILSGWFCLNEFVGSDPSDEALEAIESMRLMKI